jgi:hypothetical protein
VGQTCPGPQQLLLLLALLLPLLLPSLLLLLDLPQRSS